MDKEEQKTRKQEIKRAEIESKAIDKKKERETLQAEVTRKKSWFQKIPTSVLLSPGGFVLILLAAIMEFIDLIPLPFFDQLWELPLELFFIGAFLYIVPNASFKSTIIPFLIERIPVISDVLPTWVLRMIA